MILTLSSCLLRRCEPYHRGNGAHSGALAHAPNLFCTPHSAWYSPESRAEMRRKGAEAARAAIMAAGSNSNNADYLNDYELRNVVNVAYLDTEAAARRTARRRASRL